MDRGAHFHRTDLQVHSPRDQAWTGPNCVSADQRKAYAASLIQTCRARGLDAIAVSDHHDLLFVRYVRQAARLERTPDGDPMPKDRQIVVFPAIELTLNVPCQAIVVFDAEFPEDLFPLTLNALAIVPSPDTDAKTAGTKRLDHITTLEQLHEELDKHTFLKGRYIVLPNVSDSGAATLLRKGNNGKYVSMPCVGGYLDGSYEKLGKGNRTICAGKDAAWGNKRIALFQTSDSRRDDHKHLGEHSTWIKWAVPTAEALRQACLAQESRVSQTVPDIPNTAITYLSVSGSLFLGPINVEFNPQYNALIGGRGTGKSTILEYLRWALCDQLPDLSGEEDLPNYQLRRSSLIEKTLKAQNASVEVGFTVNGIPHVIRRNSATQELLLKVGDGEFSECKESDVRTLLPIQAYSQKQLSNVSVRLEELSRFIEAPIRGELDDLKRRFDRNAVESRQIYATIVRKRNLQRQINRDELQLNSLIEQAESIRKSLGGLSEEDQKLLDEKPRFDQADEVVDTHLRDLEQLRSAVDTLTTSLADLPSDDPASISELPKAELLKKLKASIAKVLAEAKKGAAGLSKIVDGVIDDEGVLRGETSTLVDRWTAERDKFNASYEEAKSRASTHQTRLNELAALEKRIATLRATISKSRKELAGLGKPEQRFSELREAWVQLHKDRHSALDKECINLTTRSKGEIRARLHPSGDLGALLERLKTAMSGSGTRRDRLEKLTAHIANAEDPFAAWTTLLDELESLASYDPEEGEKALPKTPTLRSCGLVTADITKIAAHMTEENWLPLALSQFADQPSFEYRIREKEYIPFENASAGQQATSLLKALLNQAGPPLIIDQPEEDLDNPVILEVVEQIWNAKSVRQLIFSSHNANLVVNGDAELVIWCDHRKAGDHSRGQVSGQGAIDVPDICMAIKKVMEGGEAAFNLRRAKYGF